MGDGDASVIRMDMALAVGERRLLKPAEPVVHGSQVRIFHSI